ncbi:MAG: multiheme c-type cytochrome, partial [Planctomycetota bacterium]
MSLNFKKVVITILGLAFLISLIYVQKMEVARKEVEAGLREPHIAVPASSERCVSCHTDESPGIVDHWKGSTHALSGVSCFECHEANEGDADAWAHEGYTIATIVTPRDCARCHDHETQEFLDSHHAKAGRILHSLDNRLAEVTEGNREPYNPHGITPGREDFGIVNGLASAQSGCWQCHGSKVAFVGKDGTDVTVDELLPDEDGIPTNLAALANILKDADGKPQFVSGTWPNTGIGRKNFDGTEGSCTACHSRHDFSPRRARQPENCGKCH